MKNSVLHLMPILVLTLPSLALAQDIIDHTPLRHQGEAVDWSRVSLPPSDPYTLSYRPPRPEGALDVTDEASCQGVGGKWGSYKKDAQELNAYGCTQEVSDKATCDALHGTWKNQACSIRKQIGLWHLAFKTGFATASPSSAKNTQKADTHDFVVDASLGGYIWYVDGLPEGESVRFDEKDQFIRVLQSYRKGTYDGPTMQWDERGQLVSYIHYEDGLREGPAAQFTRAAMPEYYGGYHADKPSGDWYIFSPFFGTLLYIKRYDRKVPDDLLGSLNDDERLVWVEEYDGTAGKKIKEGYRSEHVMADPVQVGDMYDKQYFYDTHGEKWLEVMFGKKGMITDAQIQQYCKPFTYYHFNHDARTITCQDDEGTDRIVIQSYATNEVSSIERLEDEMADEWSREEFYKDGSHMTEPAAFKIKKINDYYAPISSYHYIYSKTDQAENQKTGVFAEIRMTYGSGYFKSFWSNGNLRMEGNFVQYKKDGPWRHYSENGAAYREANYSGGRLHGTVKSWFGDGMPDQVFNYTHGIMDGTQSGYYTLGGLAWEAHHELGRLTGVYREYSGTGALKKEMNFDKPVRQNGETVFPVTLYYSNGNIRAAGFDSSLNEERDGTWRLYLKSGEFWREVTYQAGQVVSKASSECSALGGEYVIDEDKLEEGCYLPLVNRESPDQPDKLRHGFWRWWDEKGSLQREGTVRLGHFYGKWRYFFPGGTPGVEPDEKYLMLEGTFDCDRPVGNWRGYYAGNVKKFDGQYDQNGRETGIWTTYHPTGAMSSVGEFKDGKRIGAWKWGHENHAVRETGTFEDGNEVGTWQSWYSDGQEAGKGDYVQGMRTGEWVWKRDNGEIWRKTAFVEGRDQSVHNPDRDEADEE